MPLRILLVSDVYRPAIGGAEIQTQLLAHKLTARGHTVHVATSWQPGQHHHEHENAVEVHRVKGLASLVPWFSTNPTIRHHPPFPDPGTVVGLLRVIKRMRPDVVHVYGWIAYSSAIALLGTAIPLILALREYANTCAVRTMLHRELHPCSGPQVAKCLSCSTGHFGAAKGVVAVAGVWLGKLLLRKKVRALHAISQHMHEVGWRDLYDSAPPAAHGANRPISAVIPSFRDADHACHVDEPLERYRGLMPREPYILFVGTLRRVKGVYALLEAYARLRDRPPLVLIGPRAADTPDQWPEGVHVHHNFPRAAILACWERALFGVFPSLWAEPFGSVVHEAMSKGRPVIGTAPGGHSDMITPGSNGFLVAPGDVQGLAGAMQTLLDDAPLRMRMGQNSLQKAAQFSADLIVPRFERFFEEVVRRSRPGSGPTDRAERDRA